MNRVQIVIESEYKGNSKFGDMFDVMYLKCSCGFKGKIDNIDKKVTCPKCFAIWEKEK